MKLGSNRLSAKGIQNAVVLLTQSDGKTNMDSLMTSSVLPRPSIIADRNLKRQYVPVTLIRIYGITYLLMA
jgi:hypothetical protein